MGTDFALLAEELMTCNAAGALHHAVFADSTLNPTRVEWGAGLPPCCMGDLAENSKEPVVALELDFPIAFRDLNAVCFVTPVNSAVKREVANC